MPVNAQPNLPGIPTTLGDAIRELVKATRDKITSLAIELAAAKAELAEAKRAVVVVRKTKSPKVKAKAKVAKTKAKGKKGGRPKGSKNRSKVAPAADATPAPETTKEV